MADPRVVRVLTGSRAGAEAAMPASGRASVGYEYWHDVVVRDASAKGCAVEIEATDAGVARLTVLDGAAVLLGSTLASGDTATLPAYVPVIIGDIAFAYGVAGSERWSDASLIAANAPAGADTVGSPAATLADDWRASLSDSTAGRLGRALNPRVLVAVGVAIVALLGAGPAIDALQLGGTPAERTQRALAEAGYRAVTVKDSGDDTIIVGGYVPTDNDRVRVQSMIQAKALRATLAIETGDELSRSVADVARMNGIEVKARALRPGTVELTTAALEPPARERLEAAVRRDVPSLRRLVFRHDETLDTPDTVKTVSDAAKRVATVVSGEPAYIVTADGARYFPGAIMPSGHRLVAIREQTVVLERNGRQLSIKF